MCKSEFSSSQLQDAPNVDEIVENYKILLAPPNETVSVMEHPFASPLVQSASLAYQIHPVTNGSVRRFISQEEYTHKNGFSASGEEIAEAARLRVSGDGTLRSATPHHHAHLHEFPRPCDFRVLR